MPGVEFARRVEPILQDLGIGKLDIIRAVEDYQELVRDADGSGVFEIRTSLKDGRQVAVSLNAVDDKFWVIDIWEVQS